MYSLPIPSSTPVAHKIFNFCQRQANIHFIPLLFQGSRGLPHVPKASPQLFLGFFPCSVQISLCSMQGDRQENFPIMRERKTARKENSKETNG